MTTDATLAIVRRAALPFEPTEDGLRPLVEAMGDAQVVLIGEATHGIGGHSTGPRRSSPWSGGARRSGRA